MDILVCLDAKFMSSVQEFPQLEELLTMNYTVNEIDQPVEIVNWGRA